MTSDVGREHVEAVACCIVREYLFRKSQQITDLRDVLSAMEKAFPRSAICFQQRDQLIRAIHLEKACRENKNSGVAYKTLLEIIVADRLERRRLKYITKDMDLLGINGSVENGERSATMIKENDRQSPVGIPAKATASILAPGPNEFQRKDLKRRASAQVRTKKNLLPAEDGFSSNDDENDDENNEEFKPPIKVTIRSINDKSGNYTSIFTHAVPRRRFREREDRLRPQSARFRPDQNRGNQIKEPDLQRRKSAWSNLARPTASNFHAIPSPESPIAPLKPMSPARLSSGVERLNSSNSATALLERADDIIKKKTVQMGVTSPPVTPRSRKVEAKNGDISFEDLSMQHDEHGVGNKVGNKVFAHRKITVSENEQLQMLLFGDSSRCFGDEWLLQSLEFSREESEVAYGLKQVKGGPCGVLAVAQAYLLKNLLWPQGRVETADVGKKLRAADVTRRGALLAAIHEIITRANPVGPYKYVLGRVASKQRTAFTALTIYNLPNGDQLLDFLVQRQTEILRGGVVQLLISVVLSRGVDAVRKDMDQPDHTLIGRHNHTSQEVVNLMLLGCAVSNLFNGEVDISGTLLKGVPAQSTCGLLSLMETSGIIEVGSYLKSPKFPVWVVLADNHYFVLFATSSSVLTNTRAFSLFVYDGLAKQETNTIVRVVPDPTSLQQNQLENKSLNTVELCIRTKWKDAFIEEVLSK